MKLNNNGCFTSNFFVPWNYYSSTKRLNDKLIKPGSGIIHIKATISVDR